ncbi:hypothetical protein Msil_1271 [Methylocella silvestris BL2]|uniref:DUF4148 domain-containing protein n=1 Tax=Methylocella silvestris (strain DSM 15510 / CIP 108128 / LMG 27833 / NCIMB 13906 / BL2) TaxID=395965 RepID=B8EPN5_METSB|nr:hypothetical protein [Methylocella silvestris]ACK50240.1 hypothetical protein Msil_1271 [Methylocella silvestris BL2]
MSNTRSFLFVGAAIMAGLLCREASAEDPSRAFIDRLSGEPFRTNSAGPVSTKIETNPAQAYIDRLAGATQVAEHLGPGTTAITTDTTQDFIDRVAAPHAFTTRGASTGRQRSAAAH